MIHQIFSIYDVITEDFSPPFYSPTLGSGERAFSAVSSEEGSIINKHTADYHLYHLGSFDSNTGVFTTILPTRVA